MNLIINILIFCIVLFIYLHVYFHLKTSDDLEVYEIEQPSKERLEEICDQRQPVILDFANEQMLDMCKNQVVLDTYGAFDIKLRDVTINTIDEELYVPLSFSSALNALKTDNMSKFISENNKDFLEETGLIKTFRYNDAFLRPYMVSNCEYDYMIGSAGAHTPFRYELAYRCYLVVTSGKVKIKLSPPKNSKYLYPEYDYENFEFRSPVNPWNIQTQYRADFNKMKCLEVIIPQGKSIYIPAYWWYSIEYEPDAVVCMMKYRTYMNNVAILPRLFMSMLQRHNIKRKIAHQALITDTPNIDKKDEEYITNKKSEESNADKENEEKE